MESLTVTDTCTAEEIGRDLLERAMSPEGAISLEDAASIHRAVGWPRPQLEDGAVRAPTPDEIERWNCTDPALIDAMSLPELVAEVEHRSPAIYATMIAA